MPKTAKSKPNRAARSTKTRGRSTVAQSARPAKSARTISARSRTNGRPRAKRAGGDTLGASVDRCVATLDGWRKECAAKFRKLIRQRTAHAAAARKPRRSRKHAQQGWFASGARQLGLGVRRGAEMADPRKLFSPSSKKARSKQFNRLAKFCKKELKELAALVARLDALANQPGRPARSKRK
jgi:hypothetical protein